MTAHSSTGMIFGSSGIGEKKISAETVGETAAKELVKNLDNGSCVDEYLQDQLIIFMALANGKSKILTGPVSLHTETAIEIAKQLTSVS